jgi:sulfide:quinone oxidoreductase
VVLDIHKLDDSLSVSAQLQIAELEQIAARGFRSVINNRPDAEAADQPESALLARAAAALGLEYRHIPVLAAAINAASVTQFRHALNALPGPVVAFCRSGMRSTTLWALANSEQCTPEQLIACAKNAGYDLEALRAQLAVQQGARSQEPS